MPKRPALQRRSERSKKQTTNARQQKENQIEDDISQNTRSDSDILGNEEFMQNLQNQNVSHRSTATRSTNNPTNPEGNRRQENPVAGSSRRKTNKPSRRSLGTNLLRQIRVLQNSTNFLIPKISLTRVVREICADLGYHDIRFTASSLLAIQEATETYLTIFLQDSYVCTLHRDRKTLSIKDMRLVRYLRGPKDLGNI